LGTHLLCSNIEKRVLSVRTCGIHPAMPLIREKWLLSYIELQARIIPGSKPTVYMLNDDFSKKCFFYIRGK